MSINSASGGVDGTGAERLRELRNGTFTSRAFNSGMRLDPGSEEAVYRRRALVDDIITNNACAPRSIVEAIIAKIEAMNPELHEGMESYLAAYDKLHKTLLRYRNVLAGAGSIEFSLDPFSPILFIEEDAQEPENIDLSTLSATEKLKALKKMQEQTKREIAMQDIAHANKILGVIKKQHEGRLRQHLVVNENIDTESLTENLKRYIITGSKTGGQTNRDTYLWNGFQCKTDKQKTFMDYMLNNGGSVNRADAYEHVYGEPYTPEKAGLFSSMLKPFREHRIIDVGGRQGVIVLADNASTDLKDILVFTVPDGAGEEMMIHEEVIESMSENLELSERDTHVWEQLQKNGRPVAAAQINKLFPGTCTLPEAMKEFPGIMERINTALESTGDNRRISQEHSMTKIVEI